jgi:hypothetical protein
MCGNADLHRSSKRDKLEVFFRAVLRQIVIRSANFTRYEMALSRASFYPHRRKSDSFIDSICLNCLLTIASSYDEQELVAAEKVHVCQNVPTFPSGITVFHGLKVRIKSNGQSFVGELAEKTNLREGTLCE